MKCETGVGEPDPEPVDCSEKKPFFSPYHDKYNDAFLSLPYVYCICQNNPCFLTFNSSLIGEICDKLKEYRRTSMGKIFYILDMQFLMHGDYEKCFMLHLTYVTKPDFREIVQRFDDQTTFQTNQNLIKSYPNGSLGIYNFFSGIYFTSFLLNHDRNLEPQRVYLDENDRILVTMNLIGDQRINMDDLDSFAELSGNNLYQLLTKCFRLSRTVEWRRKVFKFLGCVCEEYFCVNNNSVGYQPSHKNQLCDQHGSLGLLEENSIIYTNFRLNLMYLLRPQEGLSEAIG
jgi:hypothetical protein